MLEKNLLWCDFYNIDAQTKHFFFICVGGNHYKMQNTGSTVHSTALCFCFQFTSEKFKFIFFLFCLLNQACVAIWTTIKLCSLISKTKNELNLLNVSLSNMLFRKHKFEFILCFSYQWLKFDGCCISSWKNKLLKLSEYHIYAYLSICKHICISMHIWSYLNTYF